MFNNHPNLKCTALLLLSALLLWPEYGRAWKQTHTDDDIPVSWENSCLYYSLHQQGSDAIAFEDLARLVRSCFDQWQQVQCSYYAFVQTASASVDRVEFNNGSGNVNLLVWRKNPGDWPHTAAAVALTTVSYDQRTGEIVDVDIEFNEAHYEFGTLDDYPVQTELIDLASTVTHEIGHCVGLDHSEVFEATMAAYTDPGEIEKRTLAQDDVEGLCHIYPVEENPNICEEPICGLDLSGTSQECANEGEKGNGSGCAAAALSSTATPGIVGLILSALSLF